MTADGSLALWRAVILRVIDDAAGRTEAAPDQAKLHRQGALAWLGVPDFKRVCLLADIDPGSVRQAVLNAWAKRPQYLNERNKWSPARREAHRRRYQQANM